MTRMNLFLVIAIILSAMFLVHSHYEARRSFMILEAAMKEATRLELEHERLQVERRSQASPLRIEQIAKQQLQMRLVTPGITQYVKWLLKSLKNRLRPSHEPQCSAFFQSFAGQQNASLAQQTHCGRHGLGLCGLGGSGFVCSGL